MNDSNNRCRHGHKEEAYERHEVHEGHARHEGHEGHEEPKGHSHAHTCSHEHKHGSTHNLKTSGAHVHAHHGHGHHGHAHGHHGHGHHGHAHGHHGHGHHGHAHGHHGHGHHHGHAHGNSGNRKGLTIALLITGGIMVLEFVGGLVTNSLALLSDSGHMLSDTAAIALSLVAFWFAAKPATAAKTYGFHRFEILAALFNALTLFVIAGMIAVEAYHRFGEPPEVAGLPMMLIASVGLLANLISAWALMRKGDIENNLNVRSAYLHILGDALGSVGAIAAGLLVAVFGWNWADPLVSVIVALLILRGAWSVLKSVIHILMEGAPDGIAPDDVRQALLSIRGVREVHDLHVWTITSGLPALSGHLRVEEDSECQQILREALAKLDTEFGLKHATLQLEKSDTLHEPLDI